MKDRVLAYLRAFADHNASDWPDAERLANELKKELGLDDQAFRQNSNELLSLILHQYDQFSISTIDAFFQRVIRAFTRESGLIGDYRLEVDQKAVLEEVINNLIDELVENKELTRWVVEFARESLESDKTWDVRARLAEFAEEIFKDEFKLIEEEVSRHTEKPEFFSHLRDDLWKIKNQFLKSVSVPANEIQQLFLEHGWDQSDFKWGAGSGIKNYLAQFGNGKTLRKFKEIGKHMGEDFLFTKNWPGKNPVGAAKILEMAEREFIPRIKTINNLYATEYPKALTAEVAMDKLYVFGLLADIAHKLQDYKRENNVMLLADAPKFLNKIIGDTDTPFVYEKVGSFYRNYLIDEFQDTSGFQWKNFLPLLTNSLDQGYESMVVGDVKQAIYRWRGGDLNLLEQKLEEDIGPDRIEVKELDQNFRSAKDIVLFNNAVFAGVADLVAKEIGSAVPPTVYRDVEQAAPIEMPGFVKVDFIQGDEEDSWKAFSKNQIAKNLEYLQSRGVPARDIAILVRRNLEGQEIAAWLLEYKHSPEAVKGISYEVVSNESLRIDGAATVNLLLGALRHLVNPDNAIARAQLSYEYSRLHHPTRTQSEVFDVTNQVFFESQLPDAFTREKLSLRKLPLFELTETLIGIFELGKEKGELAYLQAFQDLVLDFYSRERNDLAAFLEWWEDNKDGEKTSIKLSGEVDAVKILSIHKAKGLQFKYVLIPLCSWSVDHDGFNAPILWVTADQEPYAGVGPMPVKYSPTLDKTYFQEAYQEEKIKSFLDNLNLMYVALTRAEKGMIITASHPKSMGHKGTVASWLYQAIRASDDLGAYWNEATQELTCGQLPEKREESVIKAFPLELSSYPTSRWRDKLVIRQSGNIFFEGMNPATRERINYGIYLHAVLSRIKTSEDINAVLDRLVQEGLMTSGERAGLEMQLNDLLSNPVVRGWFQKEWDVRTEVPILLPGGSANRIDRLMLQGEKAVVVDFKTGEKSKADQKQVLEYIDILKQMNFTDVEGYLLYTRDSEVISVGDGKQQIVKKKNRNQLGLDF